jgi:hypothetical protein
MEVVWVMEVMVDVMDVMVGMQMVHHPIHFQGTLAHQSQTHHQEWGSLVVNERWWFGMKVWVELRQVSGSWLD